MTFQPPGSLKMRTSAGISPAVKALMRKREEIQPNSGDKRYARRDENGRFTDDQTNVGKSLAADRRQHSKHVVPKGMGDKGDQKKTR